MPEKITKELPVSIWPPGEKREFPNLHMNIAELADDCPVERVSVSAAQPNIFYFFLRDGGFYTVNIHNTLEAIVNLIAEGAL